MLYSLLKQETFNFNNFISTKYIALYFTNVLEGIFVELHDKIILNILSKTCVLIYSEKNPLLKPRMWALSFCLDYWVWPEEKATTVAAMFPVVPATRDALWNNQQEHGTARRMWGVCVCFGSSTCPMFPACRTLPRFRSAWTWLTSCVWQAHGW